MATYLERYLGGDHQGVWDDLTSLGSRVRIEPLASDALAVAHETMRRAQVNLNLLTERLRHQGYRFGEGFFDDFPPDEREIAEREAPVLAEPDPHAQQLIESLERSVGVFPLSLRAWYETLGSVNLVGGHPRWTFLPSSQKLDPLFVYSLPVVSQMVSSENGSRVPGDPYPLPIAPDEYFKYGMSGGGSYFIYVPSESADALLEHEWRHTTFVNYLRICFHWAGFPGLEKVPSPPVQDIEALREGFLPL